MGRETLTDLQRRRYKLEGATNFRFIAKLFATKSSYVLTSADFAPLDLQLELSDLGQYTEVVHGSMSPKLIWAQMPILMQKGYPLEAYDALKGTNLVSSFYGHVAKEQTMVVYRPTCKQLIIAFSGTATLKQALRDIETVKMRYPRVKKTRAKVHRGFWKIYSGVSEMAFEAISKGAKENDVQELVIGGHSLGGVQATYFLLDILRNALRSSDTLSYLPPGIVIKFVTFGTPRPGDKAFSRVFREAVAEYRSRHGEDKLREYAIMAYNDGVPALPPKRFGFRHVINSFLYLHHGCLYNTPPEEVERTFFQVEHDEDTYQSHPPEYPLGGHNYYNGRDMEKLVRRMQWLDAVASGELPKDWEHRYAKRLEAETRKLTGEGKSLFTLFKREKSGSNGSGSHRSHESPHSES